MKKARKKRIVRRKRRISEREIMRIKRKLKKSARKLRLGAKRTGAYVYGTLRRIVGNPGRLHKNLIIANKMWYSVYLHGKKIDDVQYTGVSGNNKAEREQYVYRSLVGHDGYDPAIVVKEDRLVKNPARGLRMNRRRTVRKNPASKARPIPGKFYRVYWSHPSRGETGQITFTGDQLLKIKSVTELSRYWPIKEGLKMAKVHFRGPYDSWDDAFMDR